MTQDSFEYDVAFSFAAQDEAIASNLNDLLAGRLRTFIYSERQKEIAGRDGQEAFSEVYAKKARLVVILYRAKWGETPWTRIEMNAIKNRSLDDGWDFTVFILTEPGVKMPPWLPKTRLYVGLDRWGPQGAAAVIEARATEAGASAHEETLTDRAARSQRAANLKQKQEEFERSEYGVNSARSAYNAVREAIGTKVDSISGTTLKVNDGGGYFVVQAPRGVNLVLSWRALFSNSLEDAIFEAKYYKGFPSLPGFYPSYMKAEIRKTRRLSYKLVRLDTESWVEKTTGSRREFSPQQLADSILMTLFDVVDHEKD